MENISSVWSGNSSSIEKGPFERQHHQNTSVSNWKRSAGEEHQQQQQSHFQRGTLQFSSQNNCDTTSGIIMEGGIKCIKYMLFAFNLVFAITGLALIITGCVIQGVYSNYLDFLGDSFFNTPVLLVVVGCIIFFITFFGCCGAIKEHHGMTIAFSVLLALILVVELGAGIASYAFRDQVGSIIEHNMEKGLKNYGMEGYKGVTETWNIVQHELKCCGAQEYMDWGNTTFASQSNSVPDSCCLSDVEGCGKGILSMSDEQVPKIIYTNGCLNKLKTVIEGNVASIGGIGVGIAVIQFAGIIFACVLAATIRKGYETV